MNYYILSILILVYPVVWLMNKLGIFLSIIPQADFNRDIVIMMILVYGILFIIAMLFVLSDSSVRFQEELDDKN